MTPLRVPVLGLRGPGELELDPGAARYVARVHRLGPGAPLLVFDPELGIEADAQVARVTRAQVFARVEAPRPASTAASRDVILMQSVGKGDKFDAIVRDATELGATHIVPVVAARSVSRPSDERLRRWRRIAVEAARQCGRGDTPAIDEPAPLTEILARPTGSIEVRSLLLQPRDGVELGSELTSLRSGEAIRILVGPEGGFTYEESTAADRSGFVAVTLGPRVLRTETVCAAVLGAILAFSGLAETTRRDGADE